MSASARSPLVEALVPPPDPVECCERLDGLPHRLFLDSAARGSRLGRYSYLTADPCAVVRAPGSAIDPLAAVRSFLAPFASAAVRGLPPFQGGAAGYLGYDWGLALERLPAPVHDDLGLDDVVLGIYDWVLAWDHVEGSAWLISTGMPETNPDARERRARERARGIRRLLDDGPAEPGHHGDPAKAGHGGSNKRAPSYPVDGWWDSRLAIRSSFTRGDYLKAVARVREYILAGDIFQANLSQRFETPLTEPAWAFYRRLR
jgi:para-aminobenzoate synthetase component 1